MAKKKIYNVSWDAIVTRSINIEAESPEDAWNKWNEGEYNIDDLEVDDEDIVDPCVHIDGEAMSIEKYEAYH